MVKFIGVGISSGFMGSYTSKPNVNSIYSKTSEITNRLKDDGNIGIIIYNTYMAIYFNAKNNKNICTVYYFALPSRARSLIEETYEN